MYPISIRRSDLKCEPQDKWTKEKQGSRPAFPPDQREAIMKYRFSSLDQILHSPLFDCSAPSQGPEQTDRVTRSTRLGDMRFHEACRPYYFEEEELPMLIDLFYLFYAEEHRLTRPAERLATVRLLQTAVTDKLIGRSDFAQLRKLCQGNAFVSIEAAHTYFRAIKDELNSLYDETEELVSVLTQLEKRQQRLRAKLRRLLQKAQNDPVKASKAIRTAERAASTKEQIQVITGMIQDKVRKRQRQTEEAVHIALRRSVQSAELAYDTLQCWSDDPAGQEQFAEKDHALLDRVKQNPMLQDITRQLGRMKEMLSELRKNDYAHGRGEKYSITHGRDLKNLLSGELALLASPATTPLFLRKYSAKGLLQYAKRERIHKGHGDVIVCLDESASTEGENAAWGKALALAVQDICARDGRKFALVHFSDSDALRTDMFLPGQYSAADLLSAAEHFFDGGTDFESPLREALRLIREESFENADILFITDGECSISDKLASELQDTIQDAHCSVVGLLLDADSPGMVFSLEKFCERVIRVKEIGKDDAEHAVLICK